MKRHSSSCSSAGCTSDRRESSAVNNGLSQARTFRFDDYTQAIAFLRRSAARAATRYALEYGGSLGEIHESVISSRDDAADLMGILALGRSSQLSSGSDSPRLVLRELVPALA